VHPGMITRTRAVSQESVKFHIQQIRMSLLKVKGAILLQEFRWDA